MPSLNTGKQKYYVGTPAQGTPRIEGSNFQLRHVRLNSRSKSRKKAKVRYGRNTEDSEKKEKKIVYRRSSWGMVENR